MTQTIIHPNNERAATIIYLSAGLGIVNVILSPETHSGFGITVAIFTLGILLGTGYLVGIGTDWIKYILLAMMIFGVMGIPIVLMNITNNPVVGIINIIQTALEIYAIVLLFKIPKTN